MYLTNTTLAHWHAAVGRACASPATPNPVARTTRHTTSALPTIDIPTPFSAHRYPTGYRLGDTLRGIARNVKPEGELLVSDLVQARTQRMPAELWAALEAEAKRTGVSTAELVRQGAELQLAFMAALRTAQQHGDLAALLGEMLARVREP